MADDPKAIFDRQPKWHKDFSVRMANNVADFDVMLGHELAMEIRRCREAGRKLALILPVGPMGMYRWTVYFLRDWNIPCDHVSGFNMDEWSDAEGNTLAGRRSRRVPERHGGGILRPARETHRARESAFLCHAKTAARISGAYRQPAQGRRQSWWWSMASAGPATLRSGSRTLAPSSRTMKSGESRRTGWAPACTR